MTARSKTAGRPAYRPTRGAEHDTDRLQQRRQPRHFHHARRVGIVDAELACCATTATAPSPTSPGTPGCSTANALRIPLRGPTTTTTAGWTYSSATNVSPPAVPEQGRRHLRGRKRASRRRHHGIHQGRGLRRLRRRRLPRPLRLEHVRRQRCCSGTTATAPSPTWRKALGVEKPFAQLPDLVLRLRQRRQARHLRRSPIRIRSKSSCKSYLKKPTAGRDD